jgi:predicted helicase
MESFLDTGTRRETTGAAVDFDELGINEVVELLDDANMEAVVRDFGDKNPQEDPVIHFYELFLEEYDAKKRMQRGVFYTPRPVVSYIVRSVDELLRTEFGLEDGLADTTSWSEMAERHPDLRIPDGVDPGQTFLQILDPATGTGTFLVEVIEVVRMTLVEKWKAQGCSDETIEALWNEYVPRYLLRRLHGYELLMAPYAIAHLKIGLKLYETGYRFGSEERARIYLTNALEPSSDTGQQILAGVLPALAHEAAEVDEIKRTPFTVILGNPPYSNFGQLNRNPYILALLDDYKRGLDEKKINLDDDYLKFVRLTQYLIDVSGVGVLGLITNSSYLDGVGHRKMRESLLRSFGYRKILDLHGNSRRREVSPTGEPDENVFDIQQGVAISLWGSHGLTQPTGVEHSDLWGSRDNKYERLLKSDLPSGAWEELTPTPPQFFFVETREEHAEYESFWSLVDIFRVYSSGMTAERDRVAIHFTVSELEDVLNDFRHGDVELLREKFELRTDSRDWTVARAMADVRAHTDDLNLIHPVLYRPFDYRVTWYSGTSRGFVGTPVPLTSSHLIGGRNVALLAPRQTKERVGAFVSSSLAGHKSFSAYDRTSVFPLWLKVGSPSASGLVEKEGTANLHPEFLRAFETSLCLKGSDRLRAEDIFDYLYAVLSSPSYRGRYEGALKVDFPRVPLPGSPDLYAALADLGRELISVHVMESPELDRFITTYAGPESPKVKRVGWSDDTVWLDSPARKAGHATSSGTIGFDGVPERVWNFHIGGYQVCEKWLKDRKGRTLSRDDIVLYQRIVVALSETMRLMQEIDEVIEQHGGWPDAFATSLAEAVA